MGFHKVRLNFERKLIDEDYAKHIKTRSIEDIKELKGVNTLVDLFKVLAKNYSMLVFTPKGLADDKPQIEKYRRELMYAKDIRFDHYKGQIYIPFYRYKYREVETRGKYNEFSIGDKQYVQYSQMLNRFIIFEEGKLRETTLDILIGFDNGIKLYRIDISGLKIYDELPVEDVNILFDKYIKCCYGSRDNSLDRLFYNTERKSGLSQYHRRLLKENDLVWSFYGSPVIFKSLREYKLKDLEDAGFTQEELGLNQMHEVNLIDFESYIFSHKMSGTFWDNWSSGDYKNFTQGNWYFIKHKKKGIALVVLKEKFINIEMYTE